MLRRLTGIALMCRPLTMTVWPLCAGRLNSDTPIRRNSFLPDGGVLGTSRGAGAFAALVTGSVAAVSIHVLGDTSRRQPMTLTMSTFFVAGSCRASATATANRSMGHMIALGY